jgi:hypothetical protein
MERESQPGIERLRFAERKKSVCMNALINCELVLVSQVRFATAAIALAKNERPKIIKPVIQNIGFFV